MNHEGSETKKMTRDKNGLVYRGDVITWTGQVAKFIRAESKEQKTGLPVTDTNTPTSYLRRKVTVWMNITKKSNEV